MDKHFILTHGRSGSNFLANTLNKHPSLVNYGEVLGEWTMPYKLYSLYQKTGKTWADFLDMLYDSNLLFYTAQSVSAISHLKSGKPLNFKRKSAIKSIGMKDFVFLFDKRGLRDYLQSREDIKVIYLTRRNHFSRYLSLLNMAKSGIVKSEGNSQVDNQYTIEIDDLLTSISLFKEEEASGDRLVEGLSKERVISIDYEEYFADKNTIEKTHSKVFEFLGVDDLKVTSTHRKILTKPPKDYITNYLDVVNALKQEGHEKYIR